MSNERPQKRTDKGSVFEVVCMHWLNRSFTTNDLKRIAASAPEAEQREALRVLLCDWCERAFPRASRSTQFVTRLRSEEIANRVLAYFRPQYFDPTDNLELLNGKPFTGKVCTYYANGRTKRQRPYVNGRGNGIATRWHENGQEEEEGTLIEGQKNGKWICWYANGNDVSGMWDVNGKPIAFTNDMEPADE
ncbi:MAG: toxin-antitoxin system YwqK family antitoxin [Kiritimatiellia bacterium]